MISHCFRAEKTAITWGNQKCKPGSIFNTWTCYDYRQWYCRYRLILANLRRTGVPTYIYLGRYRYSSSLICIEWVPFSTLQLFMLEEESKAVEGTTLPSLLNLHIWCLHPCCGVLHLHCLDTFTVTTGVSVWYISSRRIPVNSNDVSELPHK